MRLLKSVIEAKKFAEMFFIKIFVDNYNSYNANISALYFSNGD